MVHEYLVIQRGTQWWVVFDGQRSGPFTDALQSEKSAIALARDDSRLGQAARVTVENEGLHLIYDSDITDGHDSSAETDSAPDMASRIVDQPR
jgi:hypothetical protein